MFNATGSHPLHMIPAYPDNLLNLQLVHWRKTGQSHRQTVTQHQTFTFREAHSCSYTTRGFSVPQKTVVCLFKRPLVWNAASSLKANLLIIPGSMFAISAKTWQHCTLFLFCSSVKGWTTWIWYGFIFKSNLRILLTVDGEIPVSRLHLLIKLCSLFRNDSCTTAMFSSLRPNLRTRTRIALAVVCNRTRFYKLFVKAP